MELSDAAAFFDHIPVVDAYSDAALFTGQPDLYDASERDSEAGWRRTISASAITIPARRCVKFGTEIFVIGRTVKDYFDGGVIREHALLHPTDGLFSWGTPANFIAGTGTTSFYGGVSWLKERKQVALTSEVHSMYDVYCSPTESVEHGMLVLDHEGRYLRVAGLDIRTGGLAVLVTYDLGVAAVRQISYTAAGAYDVVSDSSSGSPILFDAVVEGFATNFNYVNNAAASFDRADKVVTIRQSDVASPKPGDTLIDQGLDYRVLEKLDDGNSCWELHVRPS